MKLYPVYMFETKMGIDYRIGTGHGYRDDARRSGDRWVGCIAAPTKVDAVAKLKIQLRLTVTKLVGGGYEHNWPTISITA